MEMTWLEGIILGIVQGLTEFLPVSSSGHLLIGKELLGIEASENLTFEIVVHAATVLSTIVIFRKQIWQLLCGFFKFKNNDEMDYVLKIGVSMIPIFIVGMFFKDNVEALFTSLLSVGIALCVTAVLLALSDYVTKKASAKSAALEVATAEGSKGETEGVEGSKVVTDGSEGSKVVTEGVEGQSVKGGKRNGITYWQALVVGLGQAVAVIPGLSRSGTTIATGLICGVKREVMAQFSFLMVLIPILGEAFLSIVGGDLVGSSIGIAPLITGFISAFLSGLLACKAMIALVKRSKLSWFALYCVVVGIIVIVSSVNG